MGSKIAAKQALGVVPAAGAIEVRGARQNNLKSLDLDLPLGKLTVITGPSGSGKSSLAFETIYAEGQRRYVETFSPYMRQFLDRMDKPRVDDIRGIPPAIAIEQSNPVKTSRSTVGTMTEINDYLKLLWPRVAKAFCPSCGREIRPETAKSIANEIFALFGVRSADSTSLGKERGRRNLGSARILRAGEGILPSQTSQQRPNDSKDQSHRSDSRKSSSPQNAATSTLQACAPQTVLITFWVSVPPKTEPRKFFEFLQQQGYLRVWIDDKIVRVDSDTKIKRLGARVQVIQDRVAVTPENRARLVEAIETALRFGKGKVNVIPIAEKESEIRNPKSEMPFSIGWHCAHCDIDIRPPSPGIFSFNNPLGACPECRGFGRTITIDLNKALPDRSLSIRQGVVRVFRGEEFGESQKDLLRACAREEIDINLPFEELPKADQEFVINGEKRSGEYTDDDYENDRWYGVRGFFRWAESKTYKMHMRVLLSRYRAYTTCPSCRGGRFQPEALNYKISVAAVYDRRKNSTDADTAPLQLSLPDFQALSISEAHDMLRALALAPNDSTAEMLRNEICSRLNYLCQVGVGYLTLDRATRTLSGGEVQRVNLTTCLGASLVNALFVMDEPSIGLHPRDVGRLVRVMHDLRDKGNTLLVVEHEEQIIRAADNLIDIGPGRGERGGELVWNGSLEEFLAPDRSTLGSARFHRAGDSESFRESRTSSDDEERGKPRKKRRGNGSSSPQHAASPSRTGDCTPKARAPQSLTRDYLSGRKSIPIPKKRRKSTSFIKITGAREHNLKNIDVDIPLGVFTCVTGVSGSGKSTLIHDVLYRNLLTAKGQSNGEAAGACKSVTGAHRFADVIMVDQSPLARTPRSTPILYLGLYDRVRELFAALPEAMAQGLTASAFSFNSGSGRCERCSGTGYEKIEMQFLSDLYVRCAECEGKRFQPHVLRVRLHGKSIHDLLQLTVSEAIEFFAQIGEEKTLSNPLDVLEEVGLGYLRLGQPLNTLSGGESQRLKLVRHLAENTVAAGVPPAKKNGAAETAASTEAVRGNLFIFDEPTTGLHFDDVALLLQVFQRLVDAGHSLVVIEHNLEVIKSADWIIDLGPEAGDEGGEVVAAGTPEQIAKVDQSHTGKFLRQVIPSRVDGEGPRKSSRKFERSFGPSSPRDESVRLADRTSIYAQDDNSELARAAETTPRFRVNGTNHVIQIHGAREHNLKDIDLKIPRDQMVVITGLSGSGKSTLAFDILFAEGQRRFLDSMSPYARQFVEQLEKPDVDLVTGLPPTVAIEQRVTRGGGKSTVGTVTEVYHFLRLLFAKTGTQFCPDCDLAVEKQSLSAIVQQIETAARRGLVKMLAPLVKARKGFHTDVARWAERQGFDTLYVDQKLIPVSEFRRLERFKEHTISVVVGVIDAKRIRKARNLAERALEIGRGTAHLLDAKGNLTVLSTEMSCPNCGRAFEELDPRLFSFNSPHGACQECGGFGEIFNQEVQTGVSDDGNSVLESELAAERESEWVDATEARPCPGCAGSRLNEIARHVRVQGRTIDQFTGLSASEAVRAIEKMKFSGTHQTIASDLIPEIKQRLQFMETVGLGYLVLGRSAKTLSGGESQRIRLAAQLGSNLRGVLYVLDEPTIGLHPRDNMQLLDTLTALRNKGNSLVVVEHDDETMRRADHIIDLGPRAGIHGGEVIFNGSIDEFLGSARFKRAGDSESFRESRTFSDSKKRVAARKKSGRSNESSSPQNAASPSRSGDCTLQACAPQSLTRDYLTGRRSIPIGKSRRSLGTVESWIEIQNARVNNLKNLKARFPIGRLSVITGISGSGKSTLMHDVLLPAVIEQLERGGTRSVASKQMTLKWDTTKRVPPIEGLEEIEAVYEVDQSPIGKTSRSTPATYVKVFDEIRNLYAQLPVSRMRGYSASRFSFNAEGGRCETCKGQGVIKLEMNFLPSALVPCEDCGGKRYNLQTLEVLYNEKSIGDIMEMTIEEAAMFFSAHPKIARPLSLLVETGLGYLKLGQPSPTLSGGEAQRLKLVTELKRGVGRTENERIRKMRKPGSTLYLLEEPTIGLHMADVELLLNVLHRLVDDGHTVIVIEHNLNVIAEADYIVDLGPEAGADGGEIVAAGTPEQVAKNKRSRTAPFLKKVLRGAAAR